MRRASANAPQRAGASQREGGDERACVRARHLFEVQLKRVLHGPTLRTRLSPLRPRRRGAPRIAAFPITRRHPHQRDVRNLAVELWRALRVRTPAAHLAAATRRSSANAPQRAGASQWKVAIENVDLLAAARPTGARRPKPITQNPDHFPKPVFFVTLLCAGGKRVR